MVDVTFIELARILISFAILAPSGHNSQPWNFEITDNQIVIVPDMDKRLAVVDGDNRELFISLGCALANIQVAAGHLGYNSEYVYQDGKIVVSFSQQDGCADNELFAAIEKRHTHRGEFTGEKIPDEIEDLDFEFVLFASAMIDYEYIMELISRCMGQPAKWKMTKDELINLIRSSANLLDDRDDIIAYIDSLDGVNGRTEQQIKDGYEVFKAEKYAKELSDVARKHDLETNAVMLFVNDIVERRIFDGEKLNELLEPLDLGWRDRTRKETELMNDLVPLLKRLVPGQEISGLKAYEE